MSGLNDVFKVDLVKHVLFSSEEHLILLLCHLWFQSNYTDLTK